MEYEGIYIANRNFSNGGKIFAMESRPILISCNFIVDSTNGNGLGIRSLKGPLVQNVFMHTSATPGPGNKQNPNVGGAPINPNPASGYIVIQLNDNYQRSLSGFQSTVSPLSGSALLVASAGLTVGQPYVVTTIGTTTPAQWQALGVPAGIANQIGGVTIGTAFVAAATSATGTGAVMTPAAAGSTIMSIETVGDPNQTISPTPSINQGYGAQLIVACRNISGAIAAPAAGSVISLSFYLSDSSVQVSGE